MKIQDHRLMHQLVCSKGSKLGLILIGTLMMIACGLFTATPADVTQPTSATGTSAEPTNTPSPTLISPSPLASPGTGVTA